MRLIKWLLLAFLLLPALWFALVLSHWLPRLSDEQQAALTLMDEVRSQPLGERNAYALLWLFDYDIPAEQLEAVMAEDLAQFNEYAQNAVPEQPYESVAKARFGNLPELERHAQSCHGSDGGCLADVRANYDAVTVELSRQRTRLAREALLSEYDHVAVQFPKSLVSPLLLYYGSGGILRVAAAHEHVSGRSASALQRLCQHSKAWRGFRQRTDSLIADMLGIATIRANAHLAAEILAERPDLDQLECLSAFAPLTDAELTQCTVMVGEYGLQEGFQEAIERSAGSGLESLQARMINTQHTRAKFAQHMGYYCQEPHRLRVAQRSATPPPVVYPCGLVEKAFNPIGCILVAIGRPTYDSYYLRALDLDARLRLFNAAQWLRKHDNGLPLAERLQRLPDAMRSPAHSFTAHSDNQIQVQLLQPRDDDHWRIPVGPVAQPDSPEASDPQAN